MKTLKTIALLAAANLFCFCIKAQNGSGQIKGYVTDDELKPIFAAVVKLTQGGTLVGGATTDEDGKYIFKPLNPGYYEVVVISSTMEFPTTRRNNVEVEPERTAYVDFKIAPNSAGSFTVEAEYVKPIADASVYTMHSINAEQFLRMPGERGDIKGAIMNVISDGSIDPNGDLHIRGSRGNATEYIIDGVRSANMTGLPALSVENVSVITGGIPAQYGDLTSGVIVVTTRDYFSGIRSKRMREDAARENRERVRREKEAKLMEEKRRKEIENEQQKEEELGKPQD